MPEEPSNAMLMSAITQIFERLDTLESKVDKGLAEVNRSLGHLFELIGSVAADNSRVASDLTRHLTDHPS